MQRVDLKIFYKSIVDRKMTNPPFVLFTHEFSDKYYFRKVQGEVR
jgi:hypothetical protein